MKKPITVWECVCEKCGAVWTSRSKKVPKLCPSCKSVNWDKSSEEKLVKEKTSHFTERDGIKIFAPIGTKKPVVKDSEPIDDFVEPLAYVPIEE